MELTCKYQIVGLSVAGVLLCSAALSSSQKVMSRQEITEALAFGRDSVPTPYPLSHVQPEGQKGSAIIGKIYTPFIRVALASRRANLEGRTLQPKEVPSVWIEPLVYVAVRRTTNPVTGAPDRNVRVIVSQGGDTSGRAGIPPVWTRQPSDVLPAFESDEAITEFVIVAAFSVDTLQAGRQFVIDRDSVGKSRFFGISSITANELKLWR